MKNRTNRRYIFQLALQGMGNNKIGKILYEQKIPKPAYYKPEYFGKFLVKEDDAITGNRRPSSGFYETRFTKAISGCRNMIRSISSRKQGGISP